MTVGKGNQPTIQVFLKMVQVQAVCELAYIYMVHNFNLFAGINNSQSRPPVYNSSDNGKLMMIHILTFTVLSAKYQVAALWLKV